MNVEQIVEEHVVQKLERIGAHSHIRGLGLDDKLQPLQVVCSPCFLINLDNLDKKSFLIII